MTTGRFVIGTAVLFGVAISGSPIIAQQNTPPASEVQPNAEPSPNVAPGREAPRRRALPGGTPSPTPQGAPNVPGAATPQPAAPGEPAAVQPTQPATPGPAVPQTGSPRGRRFSPSPMVPSGGMVSLNFNRADLIEIIHIIAQHLRLTYTIDPDVKGTVTINSAEPLRSEDLLPVFHQILRMNGAVALRTGNLYHIMPIKDGKGMARPAGRNQEDGFALQIVPVRFFSVAEMKKVLQPFLQPGGEIIENPRGNFLVVMDLPSNIQRLAEIADLIDVQVFAGTRMEIYQPKVASAEELSNEMTKIMQSFAASAPQAESFTAQFIALPRINQLLVISHSEAAWTYAKRWLDRIDVIAEGPGRRIFIYPVENGKATELADVLSQALGQPASGRRDSSRTLQDLHRSTPGGSSSGLSSRNSSGSGFGSSSSFGQQNQPASAYATIPTPNQPAPQGRTAPGVVPVPSPGIPRPGAQPQQQAEKDEQLRIVPDPATNSLIIYGTAQEFQNIKNILKELDIIPRQVLIEGLVLQINLDDTEKLGFDYEILRKLGDVRIFDREFGSRGGFISGGLPAVPTGGGLSAFPTGLSGVIGTGNAVRAFVNALMTDSRVRVLSSPSVLATDNRPARIQVGSEEPVPTGTINAATTGTSISSSTTIQYRNTGRILTIIPQVNSQGLVHLQVKAEVSARGDVVRVGDQDFPSFDTQDAETTAVVQDGETLVIGGLIGERKSKTRTGVPYLIDLPVIGRFFGSNSDETQRTELIMLITPHVIRNREDARVVTSDFKSKVTAVRSELERMERDRKAHERKPVPMPPQPSVEHMEEHMTDHPPAPPAPKLPEPAAAIMPQAYFAAAQQVRPPVSAEPLANPAAETNVVQPVRPQPAEAMSLITLAEPVVAKKLPELKAEPVPAELRRTWAVQVASFMTDKAAQLLAGKFRSQGFDAYVQTGIYEQKTWHRVRIGRLGGFKDAVQLKNSIIENKPFKDAFVLVQ